MLRDDPFVTIDWHGTNDHLGQAPALRTLVRSLVQMPDGACVALYGAWGSGKTVLLRNAQRVLGGDVPQHMDAAEAHALNDKEIEGARENTVCLWFDPWEYERLEDVLSPLVKQVARAAAESAFSTLQGEERKSLFKRHALALAKTVGKHGLRALIRWGVGVSVGHLQAEARSDADEQAALIRLQKGENVDESYLEALGDAETWASDADLVERLKVGFATLTRMALGGGPLPSEPAPPGRRFVIFLDDLDRCLPERVVHLIEAVKLLLCSADAPVVFVFGLDRSVVGEAIRQQYPGAKGYTGENYLEKIFELALEAPPAAPDGLQDYAGALFTTLGRGSNANGLIEVFQGSIKAEHAWKQVLGQPHFDNPRVIKRAINRLHLIQNGPPDLIRWIKVHSQQHGLGLLTWVVGLERYRELRLYLRDATDDEFSRLWTALEGAGGEVYSEAGQRILQIPGVRGFRTAVGWMGGTAGKKPTVLVEFDERLRRIGL